MALVVSRGHSPDDWQVVLRTPQAVVRYHRDSKSLHIDTQHISPPPSPSSNSPSQCPLCGSILRPDKFANRRKHSSAFENVGDGTKYFTLLSESLANSRAQSPNNTPPSSRPITPVLNTIPAGDDIRQDCRLDGYYASFFEELSLLGRGSTGHVYLAQHVLNGNPLGLYAVKKMAIGESASFLQHALEEVRCLEHLHNPHIVALHHVWIEQARLSVGPEVPCLFLLMSYCNGGNLGDYVRARAGSSAGPQDESRTARIQKMRNERKQGKTGAIHFLSLDTILAFARDILEGLSYLHFNNVCHLDLKSENVMLHYEDPADLLPRAVLSDFGSSQARLKPHAKRTGMTGTLDYSSPESIRFQPLSFQNDMWAFGLILHFMIFLHLPWTTMDDPETIKEEILAYPGFDPDGPVAQIRHDIPHELYELLALLTKVDPHRRPKAVRTLQAINAIELAAKQPRKAPSPQALVPRSPAGRVSHLKLPGVERSPPSAEPIHRKVKQNRHTEIVIVLCNVLKVIAVSRYSPNSVSPAVTYTLVGLALCEAFYRTKSLAAFGLVAFVVMLQACKWSKQCNLLQ